MADTEGFIEPQASTMTIIDFDTTLVNQVLPRGAGFGLGSRNLILFRNLPALVRTIEVLSALAQAWDGMLPEDHPLRSWEQAPQAQPQPEDGTLSALSSLLEGVDLSGLDNPAQSA